MDRERNLCHTPHTAYLVAMKNEHRGGDNGFFSAPLSGNGLAGSTSIG